MDIRWTVIVLGALLHGTQSNQDNQESLLSGIISSTQKTSSSAEPIPTTKSKTEPLASIVLTTATNQLNGPASQTPSANQTLPTISADPASQTSPTAPISQTSPTAPISQTSPTTPNLQTSPTTQNVQTISTASTMQTTSAASTTQPIWGASTTQTKSSDSQTSSAESMQTKTTESAPSGPAGVSPISTQKMSSSVKPTPTSQIQSITNEQVQPTATVSTTSENTGPNKGTHRQTTVTNILPTQPLNSTEQHSTSTLSTSSTASHTHQKTDAQTSTITIKSDHSTSPPKTEDRTPKNISVKFDLSDSSKEDVTFKACKTLGLEMKGTCSVNINIVGKQLFARVTIDADQIIQNELYEPLEKKENIPKETIPDTLIAILGSCGALVLILCFFAAYCAYHRRSYRKNQQHLTEELHTVENGYHDNPTLEVMEVQPEMQEKKLALNGEFNDSWIVPIDNLLKEDIPDEEDTHL